MEEKLIKDSAWDEALTMAKRVKEWWQKSFDINMGSGMVTVALASLLIGGVFFGKHRGVTLRAVGAVLGAFLFRVVYALALRLDMPTMLDLLSRAEIAFSPSSTFDLIITYFVTNGNYDIFEINATLFKYGQPILGE